MKFGKHSILNNLYTLKGFSAFCVLFLCAKHVVNKDVLYVCFFKENYRFFNRSTLMINNEY